MKKGLTLFQDIGELLTMDGVRAKGGRRIQEEDLGSIAKAALIVEAGIVRWAGPRNKIPKDLRSKIKKEIGLGGRTVAPAFVESHTHLVFAGDRSEEFELRNQGVSYQEISARGGGILSTMRATRKASAGDLLKLAQARADRYVRQGVATIEAKSGYALNEKDEFKILGVHEKIRGPRIISTFLGAHAKPPEFQTVPEYLDFLATLFPKIRKKNLASRVDIFVEKGFIDSATARSYLAKAKALGFGLTVHADQLTLSGGTDIAVELGALSADHVIQIQEPQIWKLADSETTAVLLPAADLYMKCAYPPARKLIEAGARVALATDFNPGTSPTQDLSLVGLLARLEMQMSLPEVWAALTFNSAAALGLEKDTGHLVPGARADFVVIDENWRRLFSSVGHHPVSAVFSQGISIYPLRQKSVGNLS